MARWPLGAMRRGMLDGVVHTEGTSDITGVHKGFVADADRKVFGRDAGTSAIANVNIIDAIDVLSCLPTYDCV